MQTYIHHKPHQLQINKYVLIKLNNSSHTLTYLNQEHTNLDTQLHEQARAPQQLKQKSSMQMYQCHTLFLFSVSFFCSLRDYFYETVIPSNAL